MFLKKIRYTSNGSRNITKLTSNWFCKKPFNPLTWRKYSKAGRNTTGKLVTYTKGSLLRRLRTPQVNYTFRYKISSLVTTLRITPYQNKLIALCLLSTGGLVYLQATAGVRVLQLLTYPTSRGVQSKTPFTYMTGILMRMKLLSKVSLLELYPGSGVQYARSAGVYARFVKVDWVNHTGIVELPSLIRKAFSLYSLVSHGGVGLREKRLLKNTKSGYWRSFGFKSKVRGVAMNPIDHPHGGRTKAIKNPRTPWGRVTKLK